MPKVVVLSNHVDDEVEIHVAPVKFGHADAVKLLQVAETFGASPSPRVYLTPREAVALATHLVSVAQVIEPRVVLDYVAEQAAALGIPVPEVPRD